MNAFNVFGIQYLRPDPEKPNEMAKMEVCVLAKDIFEATNIAKDDMRKGDIVETIGKICPIADGFGHYDIIPRKDVAIDTSNIPSHGSTIDKVDTKEPPEPSPVTASDNNLIESIVIVETEEKDKESEQSQEGDKEEADEAEEAEIPLDSADPPTSEPKPESESEPKPEEKVEPPARELTFTKTAEAPPPQTEATGMSLNDLDLPLNGGIMSLTNPGSPPENKANIGDIKEETAEETKEDREPETSLIPRFRLNAWNVTDQAVTPFVNFDAFAFSFAYLGKVNASISKNHQALATLKQKAQQAPNWIVASMDTDSLLTIVGRNVDGIGELPPLAGGEYHAFACRITHVGSLAQNENAWKVKSAKDIVPAFLVFAISLDDAKIEIGKIGIEEMRRIHS